MFEFIVEKEDVVRKLSDMQSTEVAADIGNLWQNWDNARQKQKNIAELLRPEIYLDEVAEKDVEDIDKWKSDIRLHKIYSLNQTEQAFIWDNIYSRVDHLFDVEGADETSEKMAALQKTYLVNALSKIGIQRKLDKGIEYLGAVGELCLFVSWKTVYKEIRRRLDFGGDALYRGSSFGVFRQEVYNGVAVEALNPLDVVWDTKIYPEDADKFDACGKIIKSFETYDSISSNKLYKLSRRELNEIKETLAEKNTNEDRTAGEKTGVEKDGNRMEVLNYWGNYTLSDGTVLRNWNIVVIGRKYLAVFEHNRWVINPIINCADLRDSKNKRGIPVMWSIYDLCKEQEKKVNLQNDAQALNLNPPCYAPENFFKEDNVKLYPGRVVKYKVQMEDPRNLVKMDFPLISNEQIIQYYDQTASQVSGVFPNMQGADKQKDTTATEIEVTVQGQTTRLSKTLDTIKQNAIVPMIEKVAELSANMKFGDEVVFADINGERISQTIGDVVRQGSYEYKYTDNTGIQKKLALNQTLTQILSPVWNDPNVALDKRQLIIDALTNAGVENAEKYVQENNPAQMIPGESLPSVSNFNLEGAVNG